jgi:hypothetical protein
VIDFSSWSMNAPRLYRSSTTRHSSETMTGTGRRDQLVAPLAITYSLDNFRDSIVADFVTEQVGNPGNHSSAGNARRGPGKRRRTNTHI